MKVFNIYFKIIKKNLPTMMIYLLTFVGLSIIFTFNGGSSKIATFNPQRSDIAIINNDADSPLVNGLQEYLGKTTNIVNLGTDRQALQDALFFRKVVYILEIPQGFAQSFGNAGSEIQLKKTSIPDSNSGVYMDLLINQYLNTTRAYAQSIPTLTGQQIADKVNDSLAIKANVVLKGDETNTQNTQFPEYFRFLCYALVAIMILGVTSIMIIFNEGDLRKRNLCAPIDNTSIDLQIWLGNLVFALVVWLVLIALSCVARDSWVIDTSFLLLCLNALTMTLAALSIAFLVGTLIRGRGAQQAIANVVSLGMSFISGVFVPQYLLGDLVKSIASFTPAYWYVKAVDEIGATAHFDAQAMGSIASSMFIQLGFAAALLIVALVISKQKRTSVA